MSTSKSVVKTNYQEKSPSNLRSFSYKLDRFFLYVMSCKFPGDGDEIFGDVMKMMSS